MNNRQLGVPSLRSRNDSSWEQGHVYCAPTVSLALSTMPGYGKSSIKIRKKVGEKRKRKTEREGGRKRWREEGRKGEDWKKSEWINRESQGVTEMIVQDFCSFLRSNKVPPVLRASDTELFSIGAWMSFWLLNAVYPSLSLLLEVTGIHHAL